jgi:hypothetical protein
MANCEKEEEDPAEEELPSPESIISLPIFHKLQVRRIVNSKKGRGGCFLRWIAFEFGESTNVEYTDAEKYL